GNYWYRRDEQRVRPAKYDPEAAVHGVAAALDGGTLDPQAGSSGRALRVEGVADALERATSGIARSVAIALKSRAACLVAGKQPDLAVWYDATAGGMTTSKAYASEAPIWLVDLASDFPASRYFDATWDPR